MASEDGGPVPPAKPRVSSTAEDAFAATGAPIAPAGRDAEISVDETIAAPVSAAPAGEPAASVLPTVAATHYRTDQEIARGGMGRIVAAEDQRLGRRVALKQLIEPSGDSVGRFQREALITARLQHPGIVPVYEAGRWPTGEPFFAMKLVSGRPLDRVIADAHDLDERLALLPRVAAAADAIAYAHSQRVVHRDLKPANVLIGEYGETVVIDWGLAKDLDAESAFDSGRPTVLDRAAAPPRRSRPRVPASSTTDASTLTIAGAVMGTPAYMAPEQARGERVDQRADVFALGAMLYHLLAGVPPYDARTATDVIAAAALGKVVPLDEREDRAPAELVAIVERAMAQAPGERYPHAGELADELRRFLTGQLVSAHRYTRLERVARFVRRHRAAVTIAAVAALGFAVGGTLAVREIIQERDNADRERTIAVTRKEAAEGLIDEMLGDMQTSLQKIGRLGVLADVGGDIRDYYGTLAKLPGGMSPDDIDRMATAAEIIGRAERDSAKIDQAMKTWTDARAQLERVLAAPAADRGPAAFERRVRVARLGFQIGTIHQQRGNLELALEAYRRAKAELAALRAEAPNHRQVLLDAAENHDRLGDLLRNDGKVDQAFEEYSEAKTARMRANSQASSSPTAEVLALSTSYLKLGSINQARGESAAALDAYRAALRLRQSLLAHDAENLQVVEQVLHVQDELANLQRLIGDLSSAAATYEQALPELERLVRRDRDNAQWRRQLGNLLADLGFTLLDGGEFRRGLERLEEAARLQKELLARDPKSAPWAMDIAQSYTRAGDGHLYLGDPEAATAQFKLALDIRERLVAQVPNYAPYRRGLAWSHTKLANAAAQLGDLDATLARHEAALALRRTLVAEAPAHTGFKNELATSEVTLGRIIAATAPARAAELVEAGLARAKELVAGDAISHEWKRTLAQALLARAELARVTGDAAARRAVLDEALAIATAAAASAPQSVHWPGLVAETQVARAELAAALGDARAAAAAKKAARDQLEPLAKAGRLPATRKGLLERARR